MVALTPLSFACPKCGSADVVYSCSPSCCFNHVCSRCYATFEPETTRVGEFTRELGPIPQVDSTGPTAPCARCGEYELFEITGDSVPANQVLCIACRALLTLELAVVTGD
ncbi:MAG TPA: hypothetical protein VG860_02770 [Terriglobia bacterium]|jgi:hypothetical protein|nr:hypothetical protein [Terriglobia bacterium]